MGINRVLDELVCLENKMRLFYMNAVLELLISTIIINYHYVYDNISGAISH